MRILVERARAWRRERAWVLLQENGARLLCWSLIAWTAGLWLDELFLPPQGARAAFGLTGAAWLAAAAYVRIFLPWRRNSYAVVLDEAAREFPQTRPYLRSAWELGEKQPEHTSARLAQAHQEQTDRVLAALPERPAFLWRPSSHARRAALAALACVLTWPGVSGSSWERLAAPWRDVPLERFLSIEPGDAAREWGQPVMITVRRHSAAGGPRQAVETRLWVRTAGPWRGVPWERQLPDGVAFSVSALAEPLDYRISWRGLQSRVYRLVPRTVPGLESLRARISGQAAEIALSAAEPLSARRGAWVALKGRPNQPLASVHLRASFLPAPLALRCVKDGECETGFFSSQDGNFQFDVEAVDGRRDPAPVAYALKAVPDEPPKVELLSPLRPVQASPASVLPVAYAARDDAGLSRVTLIVRVPGAGEREIALQSLGPKAPKDFIGDFPWELAGLPVGAKVEFRVKAVDDAIPPQAGLSEPGSVEIVDFEAGHEQARDKWRQAELRLARLAAREERIRDLYSAGEREGAGRELADLPQAWKESTAAMTELARAMEADAYSNPGLAEQFSGLASELSRVQSEDLPAALAADRQGDSSSARDRHGRLAEQLRRAERLLQRGRAIQSLQDFHQESGRMGQEGERISEALESLAGGKKGEVSPEAMHRLQSALARLQERMEALQKAISALPQASPGSGEAKARRSFSMPLLQAQTSADALSAALRAGDFSTAAQIAKELAQQLAAVQEAVTAAAAMAAAAASGQQASPRMERIQKMWSEIVEEQTRLAEASQAMEQRRLARFVAAQKDLLTELAAREGVLISSAAAYGAEFPPQGLSLMKGVKDEFSSGRVTRAPQDLAAATAILRETASRGSRAEALEWFARSQEDILRKLSSFPPSPPQDGPNPDSSAAARRQGEVRGRTARLGTELSALESDAGIATRSAAQKAAAAQGEQQAAEADLDQGDSEGALAHQEKALSFLDQGGKDLESSAAGRKAMQISIGSGFSRPAGGVRMVPGGGGMGARLEFV
ncbi:MAG TPA: hypothetical protein DEB40_01815, partial [Elusimicrobia bacterium]|nr:hypothetical protein [Elusimicrobiota bacterium]